MAALNLVWARRLLRSTAATSAPLLLGGCLGADKEPVRTASSTDQVAAVLVTPTMVAPWNDVASALAPNFTMSGDTAVSKVIPTTERIQTQVLTALGLGLSAGLPGSSKSSTNTITSSSDAKSATDAMGTVTNTSSTDAGTNGSTTTTLTPGIAPTVPSGVPAGGALPAGMANSGDAGVDPVLQYKAANYLQQSVQLLNVEIQRAAQRTCYIPFVTKLKLAVMPYRPHMGYDIHTKISFFRRDPSKIIRAAAAVANSPESACNNPTRVPIVVPLLAADDLQMAANAKAVEEAQQIGLALSAMVHGVGAAANFDRVDQRMQAILNNQLSSSLTVSAVNENTLYVRIAAGNVASGQPAIIGQTYDVAVLVLVPRAYFPDTGADPMRMSIDSYTELRNAETGKILAPTTDASIIDRMDKMMTLFLARSSPASFGQWKTLSDDQKICVARKFSAPVQGSDFAGFLAAISDPLDGCSGRGAGLEIVTSNVDPDALEMTGRAMWPDVSSLLADNAIKSTILEIPGAPDVRIPWLQEALIIDDGSSAATTVLQDVAGYRPGSLIINLRLPKSSVASKKAVGTKPESSDFYEIPPSSISYDTLAQALTLTFPSLKKLNLSVGSAEDSVSFRPFDCNNKSLCPQLNGKRSDDPTAFSELDLHARFANSGAGAAAASFSLSSLSPTIFLQKDGTGQAQIRLSKLPGIVGESAVISVSGGGVRSVTDTSGSPVDPADDGYSLKKNGVYIFNLENLSSPGTVSFSGQEKKGATKLGTTSLNVPVYSK